MDVANAFVYRWISLLILDSRDIEIHQLGIRSNQHPVEVPFGTFIIIHAASHGVLPLYPFHPSLNLQHRWSLSVMMLLLSFQEQVQLSWDERSWRAYVSHFDVGWVNRTKSEWILSDDEKWNPPYSVSGNCLVYQPFIEAVNNLFIASCLQILIMHDLFSWYVWLIIVWQNQWFLPSDSSRKQLRKMTVFLIMGLNKSSRRT